MIQTWESHFGPEPLAAIAVRFPNSVDDYTPPAEGVSSAATTTARVSGGVWVASCPQPGCRGVEGVRFSDALFFCCNCRNAAWGHHPIKVELPSDKVRAGVEALLEQRPVPQTRNWLPGETLAELKAENIEHGVEV